MSKRRQRARQQALRAQQGQRNGTAGLTGVKTIGYRPTVVSSAPPWASTNGISAGAFNLALVDQMKEDDAVWLNLEYKKTPVYSAELVVCAPGEEEEAVKPNPTKPFQSRVDPMLKAFVGGFYRRLWSQSMPNILRSYEYGHSPGEAIYSDNGKAVLFRGIKPLYPKDCTPYTLYGQTAYVELHSAPRDADGKQPDDGDEPIQLEGPRDLRPAKGVWFVHDSTYEKFYGRSVLRGAWWPWRLKTMPDGVTELIFKWAYRYSLGHTVGRYPDGSFQDQVYGSITGQALMREMLTQIKSGADICFNNARDEQGNYQWDIQQWATAGDDCSGLISVGDFLDKKIQRCIGIPDEVITHEGSVGGYSRSRVAISAFFTNSQQSVGQIIEQAEDQICRPLVRLNQYLRALPPGEYRVVAKPLLPPDDKPEQQQSTGGQQQAGPGQQQAEAAQSGGQPQQPPTPQQARAMSRVQVPVRFFDRIKQSIAERIAQKTEGVGMSGEAGKPSGILRKAAESLHIHLPTMTIPEWMKLDIPAPVVNVTVPPESVKVENKVELTIPKDAIKVEAKLGDVKLEIPKGAINVNAAVNVPDGAFVIEVSPRPVTRKIVRDGDGRIEGIIEDSD